MVDRERFSERTPAGPIDFALIRARVSMLQVLETWGVRGLRSQGPEALSGPCPIHHGDNPTAFRVQLSKGLWHCFTRCGGGDVVDLVARLDGCSLYRAGLTLQAMAGALPATTTPRQPRPRPKVPSPLGFRLPLCSHSYLQERGLAPETCAHFGIGYCRRGILAGRIAVPIHDHRGHLVAYAGRHLHYAPGEEGKYRFPPGFPKSQVVFNAWRIRPARTPLLIVEGFFDVFHLFQRGCTDVVALMGSSTGAGQIEWLLASERTLILMLDGDHAGCAGQDRLAQILRSHHHPHRCIQLPPAMQPEDLTEDQIHDLGLPVAPPL